jgi:hypothetical protein
MKKQSPWSKWSIIFNQIEQKQMTPLVKMGNDFLIKWDIHSSWTKKMTSLVKMANDIIIKWDILC